eukprot:m.173912 g.173912  ORF g.173912 m.173912 type:complete len:314 (-) comp53284_c0_seq2:63-1004(-)
MQSLEVDYSLFLRFRQCLCKRVLEIDESYAPGSSVLSTPPSPPPPPPPATAATTASALAAALSASLARQHASISPVPSAQMADLPFVPYPSLAAPMFPSRGRGRGGFRGGMRGGIRSVPAHSQDIDSLDAMMDDFYSPDEVSMPPGPFFQMHEQMRMHHDQLRMQQDQLRLQQDHARMQQERMQQESMRIQQDHMQMLAERLQQQHHLLSDLHPGSPPAPQGIDFEELHLPMLPKEDLEPVEHSDGSEIELVPAADVPEVAPVPGGAEPLNADGVNQEHVMMLVAQTGFPIDVATEALRAAEGNVEMALSFMM